MLGGYLGDVEEGFPVGLVDEAIVEDAVDLVHPEARQLLRAARHVQARGPGQQQHTLHQGDGAHRSRPSVRVCEVCVLEKEQVSRCRI